MAPLHFRRSGDQLIVEEDGGTGKLIIDDHFSGVATNRIEVFRTTDGDRFLKTTNTCTATDDIIVGASGSETLEGNDGSDVIAGGGSKDVLYGGADADYFVYASATDSTTTSTARDTIMDFSQADGDIINLKGVDANANLAGDNAFVFLGAGATTGGGTLAYSFIGGNTLLVGDVDGGGDDFAILLAGNIALTSSDFIL
ncbi:M10 family metallopeptidase C-terminal domain-containing protein [Pseudoprimorskyibacter insulae]|uniref:Alginate lyase 7 n=1 Tax=Pseudoprimorskyibacter insulae TaxID=1695997 RepID=A0A2R8AZ82_9RHOB|nr:hypothetical protein [Pseudoprimorskyibacter insulae]SPF81320.1 Alginate lyase 7 [Pseudoprimorskyibacter insulae]